MILKMIYSSFETWKDYSTEEKDKNKRLIVKDFAKKILSMN